MLREPFAAGDSFLHRLDPRIRLAAAVVYSCAVAVCREFPALLSALASPSRFREQGVEGLQARLRRDLANAQWFAERVKFSPEWRVLNPVHLQTICVRHEPPGMEDEALDRQTMDWVERVNNSGEAYLTPAILDGRWIVRVSIGAILTERQHMEGLWELKRREVETG